MEEVTLKETGLEGGEGGGGREGGREGETDEEVQPHCLSHPHHHRLLGLLRHQG